MKIITGMLSAVIGLLIGLLFSTALRNDTESLEILKVGGIDNYNNLVEIYESEVYISQQETAILQFSAQLEQIVNPIPVSTGPNLDSILDE